MRYISPKEAAARWCISQRRVLILCEEGRIEGALRHSRVWLIPETAKKPADARIKSGRYIKKAQTSTPEKTKKEPEPADFCARVMLKCLRILRQMRLTIRITRYIPIQTVTWYCLRIPNLPLKPCFLI